MLAVIFLLPHPPHGAPFRERVTSTARLRYASTIVGLSIVEGCHTDLGVQCSYHLERALFRTHRYLRRYRQVASF